MTLEPDHDLLRHQAFLQRLALRLVRDEHTARDLVQAASVAYLEAPPRDGGAARAWLARVVRRLATRRRRAEVHRGDRERAASQPESALHGFAAVDATLDAQTELLALVRALPDPQREAVVLRYVHDRSPAEIAGTLGVSVHTVHTRLRRALGHLREELDRRAHGDRRAWSVALLPRLQSAGPLGVASALPLIAAFTMGTTTKLVAGAAVLAALLYVVRPSREVLKRPESVASSVATPPEAHAPLIAVAPSATRSALTIETPADVASEAENAPSAATRDPWLLDLNVEGVGIPARPTEVVLIGINGYSWTEELALRVTMDAPGRADLDVRQLIAIWDARFGRDRAISGVIVRVEHPDCASSETRLEVISDGTKDAVPTRPLAATVSLEEAAVVTGEVAFAGVELSDEVIVLAYPMAEMEPRSVPPIAKATPDARGLFRLRVDSTGRFAVVALSPNFRPETRLVSVARGASQDLGRLEASTGATLTGTVVFGDQPVGEGAVVDIGLADARGSWGSLGMDSLFALALAWHDGRFEWGRRRPATDARGRFRCEGLGPWPVEVSCHQLPDHGSVPGQVKTLRVTPPADVVIAVAMVAIELGYDFRGSVATPGRVSFQAGDRAAMEFDEPAHAAVGGLRRWTCPPDVPIVARAEFEGFEPVTLSFRSPSIPGARLQRRFELKPSTHAPASLRVYAEAQGEPLPDGTILQLLFAPMDPIKRRNGSPRVEKLTLLGGEARLEKAPQGAYHVTAFPSPTASRRTTRLVDATFELDLAPGGSREVRLDFVLGGNVALEARAPEGHLVMGWCEVFDEQLREVDAEFFTDLPGMTYGGFSGQGPSTLMQNLLPGRYTVELTTTDYALFTDVIEVRAGEVTSQVFHLSAR